MDEHGDAVKPILFATDGSPSAQHAGEYALELAQATGWPLVIVSAWTLPAAFLAYEPVEHVAALEEVGRTRAEQVLADAAERAGRSGVAATTSLRAGEAVEEICESAAELDATMIVMGARGWSRARRLLFGSVSNGVLQHASCPVLVVRQA